MSKEKGATNGTGSWELFTTPFPREGPRRHTGMDRPDPALAEGGGWERGCQQQRGENLLSQFRPVKKSKLGSFGDYLKRSTESSRGAWVLSRVQARTIPPEAWPSRPPCGLRGALRLRLSPGNPSWAKGIPKFINLDCIFFSSPPFSGLLGQ